MLLIFVPFPATGPAHFSRIPATDAQLADAELVLIGTSVYIGKLLVRDWLHKHAAALRTKKLFLFIVNATPADSRSKTTRPRSYSLNRASRNSSATRPA